MGRHKKYTYKHLTDEMKSMIDSLIKEKGKKKAYDEVLYNMFVDRVAEFQNRPYAFDVVERTLKGEPIYRWERDLQQRNPIVWGGDDMPLEQEVLFYIDGHRFYDCFDTTTLEEICVEKIFENLK